MKKNYININGTQIELTDEQVAKMCDSIGLKPTRSVKLSDVAVGETFKVGEYEFVVLEHLNRTTAVILNGYYGKQQSFGENNNYMGSNMEFVCNRFRDEIADIVGMDNLVEHTLDLTSLDGLRDYGVMRSYMSPLTFDRYRRYVEVLDKYILNEDSDGCWWLATPFSTPAHRCVPAIACIVRRGGMVDWVGSATTQNVRPYCVFKSSMTVSK